jgi:hypothetical protein
VIKIFLIIFQRFSLQIKIHYKISGKCFSILYHTLYKYLKDGAYFPAVILKSSQVISYASNKSVGSNTKRHSMEEQWQDGAATCQAL